MIDRTSLRLSAALLLAGQLLYIAITQFHTGGEANDHPAIFAAYAGSETWTVVHVGQFAAMAILLAGLLALSFALDIRAGTASWAGRFGAASAVAALALYGALQAVGTPSRLLIFPDENHWILKPQNAIYWHWEMQSWLARYIGGKPTLEQPRFEDKEKDKEDSKDAGAKPASEPN